LILFLVNILKTEVYQRGTESMMFQMTFVRWAWDETVWDVLGVRTRSNWVDVGFGILAWFLTPYKVLVG
jgi:hypothetical protein